MTISKLMNKKVATNMYKTRKEESMKEREKKEKEKKEKCTYTSKYTGL